LLPYYSYHCYAAYRRSVELEERERYHIAFQIWQIITAMHSALDLFIRCLRPRWIIYFFNRAKTCFCHAGGMPSWHAWMNTAIPEYSSFDKLIGTHAKRTKRLCRKQKTDTCFHGAVLVTEKCTISVHSNLNGLYARRNLHSRSQTTEMLDTFVVNWHADVDDIIASLRFIVTSSPNYLITFW